MEDFVELLHNVGKLKCLDRKGWVLRGVPDPESVADHSFRTAIMALLLAEDSGLDKNKCVQMALIHDIGESLIGDITPSDKISDQEKYDLERKAIESLFKNFNGKKVIDLWEEYEKRESAEAKFVYELDKMESLLQAFEYEQKHKNEDIDLSEFWPYVEERIDNPKLLEIVEILKGKKSR